MRRLLALIVSCIPLTSQSQDEKYFTVHREPVTDDSSVPFSTNGIYINQGKTAYDRSYGITFYDNGIFCLNGWVNNADLGNDLIDSLRFVERVAFMPLVSLTHREIWGFYKIRHDTLITQRPWLVKVGIPSYISIDQTWIIKGNTIRNVSYSAYKTRLLKRDAGKIPDTSAFVFYRHNYKPDSTYARFFYKDWYRQARSKQ